MIKHKSETIIIHLKKESIDNKFDKDDEDENRKFINSQISKLIETIYNKFDTKENIYYKDYIYIPEKNDKDYDNKYMPTLGKVRGKIVFFSKTDFKYEDNHSIGFSRNLDREEGEKREKCTCILGDCDSVNDDNCEPVTINNFRFQDDYKLPDVYKWKVVLKMITDENNKFNKISKDTHTLNFMNIAFSI